MYSSRWREKQEAAILRAFREALMLHDYARCNRIVEANRDFISWRKFDAVTEEVIAEEERQAQDRQTQVKPIASGGSW